MDYAPPPGPSRWAARARDAILRVAPAFFLSVASLALPHPEGIWYFGRRPQWLVAIDVQGLEIGPSSDPVLLGWVPLAVLKMLAVGLPVWMIWRYGFRPRRDAASAG